MLDLLYHSTEEGIDGVSNFYKDTDSDNNYDYIWLWWYVMTMNHNDNADDDCDDGDDAEGENSALKHINLVVVRRKT